MKTCLLSFLVPYLFGVCCGQAQGTFIYDQQSTNLMEGFAHLQGGHPMGQSFTPSLSAVSLRHTLRPDSTDRG